MTRKFMDDPDPQARNQEVVEQDTYTVEVVDVRVQREDFMWIDLKIVGGPDDGRTVSVSLNMPTDASSDGAIWFFKKKIRGFHPYIKDVWAMPDEKQAEAIAERIEGKRVEADLSVQAEGQYKGSQQLDETREIPNVAPAGQVVQQAVAVEPEVSVSTGSPPATENTDPPF